MELEQLNGIHAQRKDEAAQIRQFGAVVAAANAAKLLFFNVAPEEAIKVRDHILATFNSQQTPRKRLIEHVRNTRALCQEISRFISPGRDENNLAFQTRRLSLIETIVKSGISEGKTAVDAADLLMGKAVFNLEDMELFRNA